METKDELKDILTQARSEHDGITLNLIARTIKEVLDESEVKILIEELNRVRPNTDQRMDDMDEGEDGHYIELSNRE